MRIENILDKINTYVMCSTLNQIVNYIPIKLIEKDNKNIKEVEIFNITVPNITEESSIFKRFDNKKWDENLFNCLKGVGIKYKKEQNTIKIIRNDIDDIIRKLDNKLRVKNGGDSELNISKIKPQRDRKILWNVTGGQRSTIFAIQEYIRKNERKDDYLIYLEGNSNKIICGKLEEAGNGGSFKYQLMDKYRVHDLNLQKAFQLAGFEIAKYDQKQNLIDDVQFGNEVKNKEYQLCKRFYKYYIKNDSYGECLRKHFAELNKKDKDKKLEDKIDELWKELEKIKKDKEGFNQEEKEILKKMSGKNNNKFGYILEYMALCSIKQALKKMNNKYFIELQHSINLTKAENPIKYRNTGELCEFDIVLLSKSGQVVFFECKSGTMISNDAKARQYTAFATGGVYGKPILITPLLKEDLKKIYEKYKANKVDKGEIDEYDSAVLEAVRAAARANLEIWGIDEIKERLEELYNEAIY